MDKPRRGTRRACDPCSVRKVRCDGNHPCSRCMAASWECTFLKTHGKSGPKGPRRTTEAAIRRLQERSRSDVELTRSESEGSLDDASQGTIDVPTLDGKPPASDPELESFRWPEAVSPTFATFSKRGREGRISTSSIAHYLNVFQIRGHPIWPVVDTEALLARLLTHPEDIEAYGLASAICAAAISQFQIDTEPGSPVEGHFRVSSAKFENQARKARKQFDHMEHMTISSLLSSFFLHVYSANIGRMTASTIYLGEAITKAHILGLHKVSYYQSMAVEELQNSLKIYWLLFITERAHTIQNDVPIMLKRSPGLPSLENLSDGTVAPAFVQLCRLFNILDVTITADPSTARKALALAQQQLSDDGSSRGLENELQRADISMTQQWMRIFLWQHALQVTNMRSTREEDEFSFSFPAKVAQNVLSYLGCLSRESLEAHGPGMETKLFDIANSLADVMICIPSATPESFGVGPRDLIHSLSVLLGSFRGGNPAVVSILQEKLTTLGISVCSPQQKLLDISSSEDDRERDSDRAILSGNMSGAPRAINWSESATYSPITAAPFQFPSSTDYTMDIACDHLSDDPVISL